MSDQNDLAPIDRVKPTLKIGEVLCSGCWAVASVSNAAGWTYVKFNFLASVNLCATCSEKSRVHMDALIKAGL
jgi:hypothetical protein